MRKRERENWRSKESKWVVLKERVKNERKGRERRKEVRGEVARRSERRCCHTNSSDERLTCGESGEAAHRFR